MAGNDERRSGGGALDPGALFAPERILLDLHPASKRQLLEDLAAAAARPMGLATDAVLVALLQRERLGTTGIGDGIAIPHAKVEGVTQPIGFVARLAKPVDFEALDGKPIDLVVLLLAPADEGAGHLKALARVARLLRDPDRCVRLRAATQPEAVHALLTERPGG